MRKLVGKRALEHGDDHRVAFMVVDAGKTVIGSVIRCKHELLSTERGLGSAK